jgi:two-component system sensor histidine kinase BaeS
VSQPLAPITSIKVKLGVLVAVSVTVAAVIATLGANGGVPALLGIPVTVALALAVTQLLAVGMTSPLRAMTHAARQMAAGDYSGRIVTGSRDEIGELGAAFNLMAQDLAEVDRERRELVANVSHELRTPLAALSARLENLADGVEVADPAALEQALGQTRRLSTLVSDLLDLSRLDAGLAELALTDIEVDGFLRGAIDDAGDLGREVSFELSVSPATLSVQGDPLRLGQLVGNLLTNAGRHSPPGGVVRVEAGLIEPADGVSRWTLEISDEGPGIAPADRERVFERFGTLAGNEGGSTGLGLAISRWVCVLHGGTIRFVDPLPDSNAGPGRGARVRVELPIAPVSSSPVAAAAQAVPMRAEAAVPSPPALGLPDVWGGFWPATGIAPRRDLVLASVGTGLVASLLVPFHAIGLGLYVVLVLAGAIVLYSSPHRGERGTLAIAGLALVLATISVLRDAEWIVVLCLLAGALVMTVGITRARTVTGFVLAALSWPLAGLRSLPWIGESLNAFGAGNRVAPAIRTAAWSVLAVAVFGVLFASADPVLAAWLRTLLPEWSFTRLVLRGFITVAVGAAVLAAAYLAVNPPRIEGAAGEAGRGRQTQFRYEWLAPVLFVNAVFIAFLLAQATVVFGGHGYLRRTTGLTYAEYVHQGFGQLTVATALMLVVVSATARKASRESVADRAWLRGSLGLLCALTLVVVASALYRVQVYQEAYGFTRLRLLVDVFEGWLGFVVLSVMIAGVSLRGSWLPRVALLSGAATLAALALVNPDGLIARHNIERHQQTGKIDWYYLGSLSDDALPEIARLPAEDLACLDLPLRAEDDELWSWNWGYHRSRDVQLPDISASAAATCEYDSSG